MATAQCCILRDFDGMLAHRPGQWSAARNRSGFEAAFVDLDMSRRRAVELAREPRAAHLDASRAGARSRSTRIPPRRESIR
jgi:hypothetical protein